MVMKSQVAQEELKALEVLQKMALMVMKSQVAQAWPSEELCEGFVIGP